MAETELSQEQIDALIKQMKAKEKKTTPAAKVMSGGKEGKAGKVNTSAVLNAPKTSSYADSLSHPEGVPLEDGGKFDGDYEITIESCEVKNTGKGQLFAVQFKIDTSDNPRVKEGAMREHAIFWWTKPGMGETRVLWEKFAEAIGKELDEDVAEEIYGEAQCMTGTRWALTVSTKPQKGDKGKSFSHHRYTSLE